MTKTNLARLIVLILVFLFFVLYFMQASGYNEYTRNRENEAPTLSRLKESGEIENSARQVIFIYFKTEDNYFIHIAKNTRGAVGIDIPITFTKNTMTIRER